MPVYRFITHNGGDHSVELDCRDDKAARLEGRQAFADAAHDALVDADVSEMTMTVEVQGRVIYRSKFCVEGGDVN